MESSNKKNGYWLGFLNGIWQFYFFKILYLKNVLFAIECTCWKSSLFSYIICTTFYLDLMSSFLCLLKYVCVRTPATACQIVCHERGQRDRLSEACDQPWTNFHLSMFRIKKETIKINIKFCFLFSNMISIKYEICFMSNEGKFNPWNYLSAENGWNLFCWFYAFQIITN